MLIFSGEHDRNPVFEELQKYRKEVTYV